jgi:hypothetical protein
MALGVIVMIAMAAGPSLDSLICRDDSGFAAAAAESPHELAASDPQKHGGPEGLADGVAPCVHGHCHHVAPFMPLIPEAAGAPADFAVKTQRPDRQRVATSDPKFGLMRPPRS